MTQGTSIHIGLNRVDPAGYNGWDGQLSGCVNDAQAMKAIADSHGYTTTLLLNEQATSSQVLQAIGKAAQQLTSGDILLLTYSGHGGQVPDVNGDEDDGLDETWALYDRMLIDDELYAMWSQFQSGVRIFMLSDSCHSGTIAKVLDYQQLSSAAPVAKQYRGMSNKPPAFRLVPWNVQRAVYQQHAEMYDTLQWKAVKGNRASVEASVILISGCQDNQLSADGDGNGLFTGTLLQVWNNGTFVGNYPKFRQDIMNQMPGTQTPNYYKVGSVNTDFENQQPFAISDQANQTGSQGTPGSTSSSEPSVQGPASLARSADPPTFQVNTGPNQYYVFEITSDPNLFDSSKNGERRTNNDPEFYATWDDPNSSARLSDSSYTLADSAWTKLKESDRLYYRIGTTASQSGWDNYTPSTYDDQAASAPFIQIIGDKGIPESSAGTVEWEDWSTAEEVNRSREAGNGSSTCPPEGYHYDVKLIPQPDKLSCWAASMAMLVGYNRQQSITPESLAQEVGRSLRTSYSWDMLEEVKNYFGFEDIALPSNASLYPSPEQWCEWLGTYGPLWVTTIGSPSHAIVVHGMSGDLTPEGTTIEIINPWDINQTFSDDEVDFDPENQGTAYSENFRDFAAEFGLLGLDNYGNWRVLYIPGSAMPRNAENTRSSQTSWMEAY